jgi:iron complex transport system substrate-binding protein
MIRYHASEIIEGARPMSNPFLSSRRTVLGASAAGLSLALTGRLTAAQDATPDASPVANGLQADGTWQFLDDRGVLAVADALPERLVCDVNVAGALWDFGVRPIAVFGWNITGEGTFNAAGGNVDPNSVEFLSDVGSSEVDIEKLLSLNPDLVISLTYSENEPTDVWSVDAEIIDEVTSVAPIVCISGILRADEGVARMAELVEALGFDTETGQIAEDRAAFETAIDDFATVAETAANPSAIFFGEWEGTFYIANPEAAGDVMLFRDLGLTVPELPVDDTEYWQVLSEEEAIMYPTDIVFYSTRGTLTSVEEFAAHPTFGKHPAVLAGQIYPWNQDFILNYPGMTGILNDIAGFVSQSDANVGDI